VDNFLQNGMKTKRQTRTRKKIRNVSDRPRLTIFRSNQYCYAQIIDVNGNTITGISEKVLADKNGKLSPFERAKKLGSEIAKRAQEKKITTLVFDKGSYAYHGRVKAIAEGAREAGLQF